MRVFVITCQGRDTHFAVLLVSDCFAHQTRLERQRSVMDLLKSELQGPIHALSLRLLTPMEYKKMGPDSQTIPCQKHQYQQD